MRRFLIYSLLFIVGWNLAAVGFCTNTWEGFLIAAIGMVIFAEACRFDERTRMKRRADEFTDPLDSLHYPVPRHYIDPDEQPEGA